MKKIVKDPHCQRFSKNCAYRQQIIIRKKDINPKFQKFNANFSAHAISKAKTKNIIILKIGL